MHVWQEKKESQGAIACNNMKVLERKARQDRLTARAWPGFSEKHARLRAHESVGAVLADIVDTTAKATASNYATEDQPRSGHWLQVTPSAVLLSVE